MTGKALLRRLKLDEKALERIRESVIQAEKETEGELVLALAYESDSYAYWELSSALAFASIVFAVLLPFAESIEEALNWVFWAGASWQLPVFYALAVFCAAILFSRLANTGFMDRLLVPKAVQMRAVRDRSLRCFAESGVFNTQSHSGVLVFISYMERQVRIIADTGIAERISHGMWNSISDEIASLIAEGKAEEAFITASRRCGTLLAQFFPSESDNPDELSNGLIILEN